MSRFDLSLPFVLLFTLLLLFPPYRVSKETADEWMARTESQEAFSGPSDLTLRSIFSETQWTEGDLSPVYFHARLDLSLFLIGLGVTGLLFFAGWFVTGRRLAAQQRKNEKPDDTFRPVWVRLPDKNAERTTRAANA